MTVCRQCGGTFQIPIPTAQPGVGAGPFGPGAWHGAGFDSPQVREFASKKIAAGICGIMLGGLGVHKFILGLNNAAIIMLAVTLTGWITGLCLFFPILASVAMGIIGLIEGVIYLTKSDEDFYQTYAVQKKEWF